MKPANARMGRNKRIPRLGIHCVPNLRNSCYLYSFCQEFAKMQVRDSVIIIFGEQRGHGDNVLRVVVLDGTERECKLNCVKLQ